MRVQVGIPEIVKLCRSIYPCGTKYATENTGEFTGKAQPEKARALLKEAGYNNQPIVLLRATDVPTITKVPLVIKQQLEQAGFKVDVQVSDWQTVVNRRARKDPPAAGGWNAFTTFWQNEDIMDPLTDQMLNARGDRGWFGWQDDSELESLKAKFSRATNDDERKRLADAIQLRALETVTHVPLGQHDLLAAVRKNITGVLPAGAQIYWNIKKQ